MQYLPLLAGIGWSHSLSEYLRPPPQVLLQGPMGPQSLHPPWTAAGRVPMSTHFLCMHHWIFERARARTRTHRTLFILPLSRGLEECNMSRELLSASREYQFPARWVARSFLTLQFISPARLNLRPPVSRARRRRRNLHPRGATRARERGARCLINLSRCRERDGETSFYSATFPDGVPGRESRLANGFRRDRHLRSRSFNNWCHLAATYYLCRRQYLRMHKQRR